MDNSTGNRLQAYFEWLEGDVTRLFEQATRTQSGLYYVHKTPPRFVADTACHLDHPAMQQVVRANFAKSVLSRTLSDLGPQEIIAALSTISSYACRELWAVFWAVAHAQQVFVDHFLPFDSHEERLTGCLLGTLAGTIERYAAPFQVLRRSRRDTFRIILGDASVHLQEQRNGSDIALVIHSNLDGPLFKVAFLQAKKVEGQRVRIKAPKRRGDDEASKVREIDHTGFEQLTRLAATGCGYYLCYGQHKGVPLCSVTKAEDALREAKKDKAELTERSFPVMTGGSIEFATFLIFAMTSRGSGFGSEHATAEEACNKLIAAPWTPAYALVLDADGTLERLLWLEKMRDVAIARDRELAAAKPPTTMTPTTHPPTRPGRSGRGAR